MELSFSYAEEVPTGLSERFLKQIASRAITKAEKKALLGKHIVLNAIAVSEEKIRELNRTYRGKDAVTDILSFGEYGNASQKEDEGDVFLGELFFCPAFIRQAATEDQVTFEREMAYVFSHGVLHLLGYDHDEEMFVIQDRVTDECALQ